MKHFFFCLLAITVIISTTACRRPIAETNQPKKWVPVGNNYFITPSQNLAPPETQKNTRPALISAPADEKVIDSYQYTSPAATTPKVENLSPEQFEYEKEHLEGEK